MNDLDVRIAVRSHLHELHAGDEGTRIIEEMGIWSATARIDIAVVNGELCGFELKSARDNLTRLPGQAAIYNKVFDRVTVVSAERHLRHLIAMVPSWWGVSVAAMDGGGVCLHHGRNAEPNPELCSSLLSRLLWREEAMAILERRNLDKGYRSKAVSILQDRLADNLSISDLREEVRTTLKGRVYS